jgi:hypothetical protein
MAATEVMYQDYNFNDPAFMRRMQEQFGPLKYSREPQGAAQNWFYVPSNETVPSCIDALFLEPLPEIEVETDIIEGDISFLEEALEAVPVDDTATESVLTVDEDVDPRIMMKFVSASATIAPPYKRPAESLLRAERALPTPELPFAKAVRAIEPLAPLPELLAEQPVAAPVADAAETPESNPVIDTTADGESVDPTEPTTTESALTVDENSVDPVEPPEPLEYLE